MNEYDMIWYDMIDIIDMIDMIYDMIWYNMIWYMIYVMWCVVMRCDILYYIILYYIIQLTFSRLMRNFYTCYGTKRLIIVFTSACQLSIFWALWINYIPCHLVLGWILILHDVCLKSNETERVARELANSSLASDTSRDVQSYWCSVQVSTRKH